LHVLATQGLAGAAGLLVLAAGLVRASVRSWRRAPPEDRPFLAAVLAGLAGFAVQDLFGFTVIGCGTLFCTAAGLLSAWGLPGPRGCPGRSAEAPPWGAGERANGLWAGTALGVLVFVLNAGAGGWWASLALGAAGGLAALAVL